jgi:hypothetical protein
MADGAMQARPVQQLRAAAKINPALSAGNRFHITVPSPEATQQTLLSAAGFATRLASSCVSTLFGGA